MRPEVEIQVIERLASRYAKDYLFDDLVEHFSTRKLSTPLMVYPIALELGIHLDDVDAWYVGAYKTPHTFGLGMAKITRLFSVLPTGVEHCVDFIKYGEMFEAACIEGHYFVNPSNVRQVK